MSFNTSSMMQGTCRGHDEKNRTEQDYTEGEFRRRQFHQDLNASVASLLIHNSVNAAVSHIPCYNGDPATFNEFIEEIENGFSRITPECEFYFTTQVLTKLKGVARQSVRGKTFQNLQSLLDYLRREFAITLSINGAYHEISRWAPLPQEPVARFTYRTRELFRGITNGVKARFSGETRASLLTDLEAKLIRAYIRGLPPYIGLRVGYTGHRSLQGAIEATQDVLREDQDDFSWNYYESPHYTRSSSDPTSYLRDDQQSNQYFRMPHNYNHRPVDPRDVLYERNIHEQFNHHSSQWQSSPPRQPSECLRSPRPEPQERDSFPPSRQVYSVQPKPVQRNRATFAETFQDEFSNRQSLNQGRSPSRREVAPRKYYCQYCGQREHGDDPCHSRTISPSVTRNWTRTPSPKKIGPVQPLDSGPFFRMTLKKIPELRNLQGSFIIDSGATINLILRDALASHVIIERPDFPDISGIGGGAPSLGSCNLTIFGEIYRFQIISHWKEPYSGIVGTPFLRQSAAKISWKHNTLTTATNPVEPIPLEFDLEDEEMNRRPNNLITSVSHTTGRNLSIGEVYSPAKILGLRKENRGANIEAADALFWQSTLHAMSLTPKETENQLFRPKIKRQEVDESTIISRLRHPREEEQSSTSKYDERSLRLSSSSAEEEDNTADRNLQDSPDIARSYVQEDSGGDLEENGILNAPTTRLTEIIGGASNRNNSELIISADDSVILAPTSVAGDLEKTMEQQSELLDTILKKIPFSEYESKKHQEIEVEKGKDTPGRPAIRRVSFAPSLQPDTSCTRSTPRPSMAASEKPLTRKVCGKEGGYTVNVEPRVNENNNSVQVNLSSPLEFSSGFNSLLPYFNVELEPREKEPVNIKSKINICNELLVDRVGTFVHFASTDCRLDDPISCALSDYQYVSPETLTRRNPRVEQVIATRKGTVTTFTVFTTAFHDQTMTTDEIMRGLNNLYG